VVRWEVKVDSSLTDVCQQLFEQQDITVGCIIHFHFYLHENSIYKHWNAVRTSVYTFIKRSLKMWGSDKHLGAYIPLKQTP